MSRSRNIFFFYTGGLKRELHIINNLSIDFKKIYFFTIGADLKNVKTKHNIVILKPFILKIFLYFVSKIEKLKILNPFLQLTSSVFIDLIYSVKFLILMPNNNDIVVTENNISFFILKICKYKKIKSILDVSNTHIVDKYKQISKCRMKNISFSEKIIISKGLSEYELASYITVLSKNVYETFISHDKELRKKLLIINSGIDINIFKRQNRSKIYSICIVGVISKFKNTHNLFKIIDSISELKLNILVIGNFDHTMQKINIFNHSFTHIKSLNQKELSYYYSISKILCIASYIEGMPKVVLEANACGLPVVGFRGSSISDVIKNNVNGFIIDNDDYNDFKNKIIYLLKNKKFMSMSMNAINIISNNFTINSYSKLWNDYLKKYVLK